MTTIAYITNNIAPFRIALLDELALHATVTLYYVREMDSGVNPEYVSERPKRASLVSITQNGIVKTLQRLKKTDIIVIDGYVGLKKWLLLGGCLLFRLPYAISVDGIIQKKEIFPKRLLKQLALQQARIIFSTGLATDTLLKNLAPKTPIKRHIFTTLYQKDITEGLAKRKQVLTSGANRSQAPILFVGRFTEIKGVKEFVEATTSIKRPKIMIGGTKETLDSLGIEVDDSFTIIPFLERIEVYHWMQQAALFVLPTYDDPWGLVVVEALSNGLPVVTTVTCNAGLELIQNGKNGYLVTKQVVRPLQEAIHSALGLSPEEVLVFSQQQLSHYTIENAASEMYRTLMEVWSVD